MRKGTALQVHSLHLAFDLVLTHPVTIIAGESATGKSTLVNMVSDYLRFGSDTGITITCDRDIDVLRSLGWQQQLAFCEHGIVLVDASERFVSSAEFADAVMHSSHFFVLMTREPLRLLPGHLTRIYQQESSSTYDGPKPVRYRLRDID